MNLKNPVHKLRRTTSVSSIYFSADFTVAKTVAKPTLDLANKMPIAIFYTVITVSRFPTSVRPINSRNCSHEIHIFEGWAQKQVHNWLTEIMCPLNDNLFAEHERLRWESLNYCNDASEIPLFGRVRVGRCFGFKQNAGHISSPDSVALPFDCQQNWLQIHTLTRYKRNLLDFSWGLTPY